MPLLALAVLLLAGCAADQGATVRYEESGEQFSFAVFSDLTGGERDGVFAVAVEQMNLLRPELILSVGDLIEGATTDPAQLNAEWDAFDTRAERALAPLFRVGGNHDLSHPVLWQVWEQRNGPRYYHFFYKNALFLALDTEDQTAEFQEEFSALRDEAIEQVEKEGWEVFADTAYGRAEERRSGRIGTEQADWAIDIIRRHPRVRWTFLFLHKPAWLRPGEENFSRIESALADRPYTVFHGHVHAYQHERRHGRDYIRLGTTGGVQFADRPLSIDHISWVTVSDSGVDIANLRLSGIFDREGRIPLNGEDLCFDIQACAD